MWKMFKQFFWFVYYIRSSEKLTFHTLFKYINQIVYQIVLLHWESVLNYFWNTLHSNKTPSNDLLFLKFNKIETIW